MDTMELHGNRHNGASQEWTQWSFMGIDTMDLHRNGHDGAPLEQTRWSLMGMDTMELLTMSYKGWHSCHSMELEQEGWSLLQGSSSVANSNI